MNVDPQLTAERSTLGGLLLDDIEWLRVKKIVSAEDFTDKRNRSIFKAISNQLDNGKPADVVTLCDVAGLDLSYVATLAKDTPSAKNVVLYAEKIKEFSDKRNLVNALTKTVALIESENKTVEEAIEHLQGLSDQVQRKNTDPFRLVPATTLTAQPTTIKYLVKSYIPEKSIIEIFGAPGSGKSFVALDLSFCIANGIDWHEKRTAQGVVVYIAGEGFAGIGQRLRALELKHNRQAKNLIISKQPASLTDKQNAQWVASAVHEYDPVMVVIDTLSRNFGGGDENSTKDMNTFINHLDLYIKGDAAVMLVHHSGHSEKNRARGSSVLNGAVDVEYCITKSESMLTMTNTKAKEFEPPKSLSFNMSSQELDWQDDEGLLIKSITLTEMDWKPKKVEKGGVLTGRNEAILAALLRALERYGVEPKKEITTRFGGFETGKRVVHVDHWRKEAYMVIDVDSEEKKEKEAKRTAFNRAKSALMRNHIQTLNDQWWIISG